MCTLNLQARQDLVTQLVSLVDPKEDTLQVSLVSSLQETVPGGPFGLF